ncbi:phosphatase PAP2 family protein [Terrabacter sp. Ter38]|uniref:phosphatase PAP2 family protein n=1 Tax=Terrabacter sp. Ter38 TaxID=2926030 RepID=UPI0021197B61|nr:phosphatase PAP2 family protein [Terrabacter sp. Ter38]
MINDAPLPARSTRAASRYGARRILLAAALLLVVIPFAGLLLLVEDKWGPLASADFAARDQLHQYALTHSAFVAVMRTASDAGSALSWQIMTALAVIWLLWRRRWRLAAFAVVTIAGSSLLNTLVKAAAHRTRPVVSQPFVHEPGASFPSGHAQAAVVGFGVLLLLLLPVLGRLGRRVAVSVAVLMVLLIGFSRVALAAHFVSDVVAGFVLGAAWLAAMTALFRAWTVMSGDAPVRPAQGPEPDHGNEIEPSSTPLARHQDAER